MKRNIIRIDQEKCNGCGQCVTGCAEGAIQLVNGKAALVSETYCDGLGACIGECPVGALTIEEREAPAYDQAGVVNHLTNIGSLTHSSSHGTTLPTPQGFQGCPGSMARSLHPASSTPTACPGSTPVAQFPAAALGNWPVQLSLVPVTAPYLDRASLLIAADCTAFAFPDFHRRFLKGKVALIGCPKLDDVDYAKKLTEIFKNNDIKSVTVTRMEVPCCGGLEFAVRTALADCGKMIPWQVVTISTEGEILDD